MIRTLRLILLTSLLMLGALAQSDEEVAVEDLRWSGKTRDLKVVKVIDGDTVELASGDRVRLLHINTPEKGEPGAQEATDYARRKAQNKVVEIRFGKVPRDRYGRFLAELFVEGKSINEALVRQGLAHAFFIPPIDQEANKRIVAAQVEARLQKRGIWSSDPRYSGAFHITSFHNNAPGDDRENLNGEYIRLANISVKPENLKGYRLENQAGESFVFPNVTLPVGRTMAIHTGKGRSLLSASSGQQVFFLKRTRPMWHNKGDKATLKDPNGNLVDEVASKKKRRRWR